MNVGRFEFSDTTRSPNLNAFAERFVRSIKGECLDRMILIGERSLRRAVDQFCRHYHHERNHQGLGNIIIHPDLPTALQDERFIVEFRFLSDEDEEVGAGWYIDDVLVR